MSPTWSLGSRGMTRTRGLIKGLPHSPNQNQRSGAVAVLAGTLAPPQSSVSLISTTAVTSLLRHRSVGATKQYGLRQLHRTAAGDLHATGLARLVLNLLEHTKVGTMLLSPQLLRWLGARLALCGESLRLWPQLPAGWLPEV